jgi:hypothetical protein
MQRTIQNKDGFHAGQSNMDAELFVRLGKPMEPLFLQRMHEMIFGSSTKAIMNLNRDCN